LLSLFVGPVGGIRLPLPNLLLALVLNTALLLLLAVLGVVLLLISFSLGLVLTLVGLLVNRLLFSSLVAGLLAGLLLIGSLPAFLLTTGIAPLPLLVALTCFLPRRLPAAFVLLLTDRLAGLLAALELPLPVAGLLFIVLLLMVILPGFARHLGASRLLARNGLLVFAGFVILVCALVLLGICCFSSIAGLLVIFCLARQ
jgi:hypothetical protein